LRLAAASAAGLSALKLDLRADKREQLAHAYLEIKAWPDALAALRGRPDAGMRMALLSN
jgi:2-haloacid dehalogenase